MKTCGRCLSHLAVDRFAKNPGKPDGLSAVCKDCQRIHYRTWLAKDGNQERANRERRQKRQKDPRSFLFNEARSRAKIMMKPFTITIDDIVIPQRCPVFGELLTVRGEPGNWFSASLDEIIHGLGYIPGNVQVISKLANCMKHKASPQQLVTFAQWILENFNDFERGLDPGKGTSAHPDQYADQAAYGSRTWQDRAYENSGHVYRDSVTQIPARLECGGA